MIICNTKGEVSIIITVTRQMDRNERWTLTKKIQLYTYYHCKAWKKNFSWIQLALQTSSSKILLALIKSFCIQLPTDLLGLLPIWQVRMKNYLPAGKSICLKQPDSTFFQVLIKNKTVIFTHLEQEVSDEEWIAGVDTLMLYTIFFWEHQTYR